MDLQNNDDLLGQLKIDRSQREQVQARRALWPALAILGLLAALAGGGYLLLGRAAAVPVETVRALAPSGQSTAVLQASGYVTAEREATVSAQIQGMLTHVYFQEGEYVRRGQVLARLDDSTQLAVLAQARAQLAAAQAQLGQYRVQLALARLDLARDQALIGQHLVSQQAFDTARTQVASLAAQVLTQRRNVAVARAGVQSAQVQEDYTVVRAPFSGVVVDKPAQMGETISPFFGGGGFTQTGIATIVDMNSLEVDVDVDEAYIDRVHAGQRAVAVLDAYPNWRIPAHVIAIVPTANKSKATVRVRVALDRKSPRILPQMGVRVSFLQPARAAAASSVPAGMVWVPASSVVRRGVRALVFLVKDGRVRSRTVTLGPLRSGLRAVGGIAAGSAVVRAPPADLAAGDRVRLKKG
ncbi:MAG: efflux RND transporter periplasmic adaptor subunit [Steroidobacteraceae bacterium]